MGDGLGDSDIDMEIMDPTPVVRTKTKARAKGKKYVTTLGLRDEIRANHKVPSSFDNDVR